MASSYALPGSSMPRSHIHSHSYTQPISPSKLGPNSQKGSNSTANSSRSLRQEHSNGSLHVQTHSESTIGRGFGHSRGHSQTALHVDTGFLPTPPQSSELPSSFGKMGGHSHNNSHDHDHDHNHSHNHTHSHDHGHDHSSSHSHFPSVELDPLNGNGHSHDDHAHQKHAHDAHCDHSHGLGEVETRSKFTSFALPYTENLPLLHSIMIEKDSRRIFYFMSLNFAFMLVQAVYGFLTDSLGLLSDSIHMFFDCLALALGLFAAVSSKWPPSQRFPYGFGKIESLSGFGNGVFLMLISIEILIEATERLAEGRETKRLTELFIVSSLGLAVNLVGMKCFGHHHHGHDHSHGGHDHGHEHSHDHDHSHTPKKSHTHEHHHDSHVNFSPSSMSISTAPPAAASHAKSHGHSHDNENMRGIFLHVLADTMGSAAVIVSTVLIHFLGWPGWDPLASCVIAILIFLSSMPLVSSCAKKLLLTVPDDTEYQLRETLALVSDLRGVASYSVPRFWMAEAPSEGGDGQILGVMHIIATRGSDLEDVRQRTRAHLLSRGMDVVVQVEREGDAKCWCGGDGSARTPSTSRYS